MHTGGAGCSSCPGSRRNSDRGYASNLRTSPLSAHSRCSRLKHSMDKSLYEIMDKPYRLEMGTSRNDPGNETFEESDIKTNFLEEKPEPTVSRVIPFSISEKHGFDFDSTKISCFRWHQ